VNDLLECVDVHDSAVASRKVKKLKSATDESPL
jgi:hypothetical protein